MLQLLTPADIIAEVLLIRSARRTTVILVEGESDCDTLDPHLDSSACETIPAGSKTTVREAVALALKAKIALVLGVVDRDFDGLLGRHRGKTNVFTTERYDLESDVLHADGLASHVIRVCAGRSCPVTVQTLFELAVNASFPVAVLRYIIVRDGYPVSAKDVPMHFLIDAANVCDIAQLIDVVGGRSRISTVARSRLLAALRRELGKHDA